MGWKRGSQNCQDSQEMKNPLIYYTTSWTSLIEFWTDLVACKDQITTIQAEKRVTLSLWTCARIGCSCNADDDHVTWASSCNIISRDCLYLYLYVFVCWRSLEPTVFSKKKCVSASKSTCCWFIFENGILLWSSIHSPISHCHWTLSPDARLWGRLCGASQWLWSGWDSGAMPQWWRMQIHPE